MNHSRAVNNIPFLDEPCSPASWHSDDWNPFNSVDLGCLEPAKAGGLSTLNKVNETLFPPRSSSFSVCYNPKTSAFVQIDSNQARLSRLQRRIYGYSEALKNGLDGKQLFAESSRNERRKKMPPTYMMTLTYDTKGTRGTPSDWSKSHITRVTQWLRRTFRDLLAYAWTAEVHRCGTVHYHLMATFSDTKTHTKLHLDKPQGLRSFVPWPHGMANLTKAKQVHYLSKYIGKEHQKDYDRFPKGARSFGLWLSDSFSWSTRNECRITAFPSWVRELIPLEDKDAGRLVVVRAKGGGWCVSGEVHESGWQFLGISKRKLTEDELSECLTG